MSGTRIHLPPYRDDVGPPLEEVLRDPRYWTEHEVVEVRLWQLSQLLYACQGVREVRYGISFRTVPSAGATYPLDLYVLTPPQTSDLPPGLYHYVPGRPEEQYLEQVSTEYGDARYLTLLVTATYERTTWRYGRRGVRYVHFEVGHLLQNLIITAQYLGLSTIVRYPPRKVGRVQGTPMVEVEVGRGVKTVEKTTVVDTSPHLTGEVSVALSPELPRTRHTTAQVLKLRSSVRSYLREEYVSRTHLTYLCWAALGLTESGLRTYPPLSGRYRCGLLVAVHRVTGLEPGIYVYVPERRELQVLRRGDYAKEISEAALGQEWVAEAHLNFGIVVSGKVYEESGVESYLTELEAGMVCQNLYLAATALGLGAVAIGAFYDDELTQVFRLQYPEYRVLYLCSVGVPRTGEELW